MQMHFCVVLSICKGALKYSTRRKWNKSWKMCCTDAQLCLVFYPVECYWHVEILFLVIRNECTMQRKL